MRSSNPPPLADATTATPTDATPTEALGSAISKVLPELRHTIEVYVSQSGLAQNREQVLDLADEVLDEVVEQAIKLVDRWEPERGTRPWLAKMASFNIMQRRRKAGQDRQRGTSQMAGTDSETDLASTLLEPTTVGRDQLFELLDLVPEPDRILLRLAYVDREPQADIAQRLGTSYGALRVQLTRAKARFIQAYDGAERGGRS